ncbi:MAG: tryptophan--tRNA ligase, partial [bacterium]|nr:tryptophan--tRNA ligase [bacterium]
DPDDVIKRQIKRAVTDVGENPDEMSPGVKNLFTLLEAFAPAETYQHFLDDYAAGALRYKDLKESLTENMLNVLRPIRERRAELMANRGQVVDILHESAKKMRAVARETMREVREKAGLGALAKD